MLVAGCSNCRSIAPLWCAGQVMPHAPLYVEPSPMGPYCGWCGLMPPVFTCVQCGTTQGVYMTGMAVPRALGQGLVAPVFAASEGTSQNQLVRGLRMRREHQELGIGGHLADPAAGRRESGAGRRRDDQPSRCAGLCAGVAH